MNGQACMYQMRRVIKPECRASPRRSDGSARSCRCAVEMTGWVSNRIFPNDCYPPVGQADPWRLIVIKEGDRAFRSLSARSKAGGKAANHDGLDGLHWR